MLVRYHSTRAYRLYDPKAKKVVISNDALFDESKSWDWNSSKSYSAKKGVTLELESESAPDIENTAAKGK